MAKKDTTILAKDIVQDDVIRLPESFNNWVVTGVSTDETASANASLVLTMKAKSGPVRGATGTMRLSPEDMLVYTSKAPRPTIWTRFKRWLFKSVSVKKEKTVTITQITA